MRKKATRTRWLRRRWLVTTWTRTTLHGREAWLRTRLCGSRTSSSSRTSRPAGTRSVWLSSTTTTRRSRRRSSRRRRSVSRRMVMTAWPPGGPSSAWRRGWCVGRGGGAAPRPSRGAGRGGAPPPPPPPPPPPVTAQLREPPTELTLYFSEPLERKLSGARVVDQNGERVDEGVEFDATGEAAPPVFLKPLSPGCVTTPLASV